MMLLQQAIFTAIRTDVPLQSRIGGQYYPNGRVPLGANVSATQGLIHAAWTSTRRFGGRAKEFVTVSMTILSLSMDLSELIAQDLDRLFHTLGPAGWRNLSLPGPSVDTARITREFGATSVQPGNELAARIVRFRMLYAPAA